MGSKFFIEDVKDKLGYKAIGKKIASTGDMYQLKETKALYTTYFDAKMDSLRPENRLYWNVYHENSEG